MQIANQWNVIAYDSDDFFNMQAQKFTATDLVVTRGVAIIPTSAQSHTIFGNDKGATWKHICVVTAEEMQPTR